MAPETYEYYVCAAVVLFAVAHIEQHKRLALSSSLTPDSWGTSVAAGNVDSPPHRGRSNGCARKPSWTSVSSAPMLSSSLGSAVSPTVVAGRRR